MEIINNMFIYLKRYSLSSLILFIVFLYYIRSSFLKLTLFIPTIISLFLIFISDDTGKTMAYTTTPIIVMLVLYFFMCINYKNQICESENKKNKSSSFRSALLALIPYIVIMPLMIIVLKLYPRDEFVNIFGETYGVLANRMKIMSEGDKTSEMIIKKNNGMFIWVILTALYMTHVGEMVLVLNEC